MKILYVGSDIISPSTTMEGKMIERLVNQLDCSMKKHQVKILSINISQRTSATNRIVPVHGTRKGPIIFQKIVYGFELIAKYLYLLKKENYHIVHFIWVGFTPIFEFLIQYAKRHRIKVIVTILNRHSPPTRYRHADHLVFHSYRTQQNFITRIKKPPSSSVILPGISKKKASVKFNPSDTPYFVFASGPRAYSQIKNRGIHLLFDAFGKLSRQNSNIQLRFIGRWPRGKSILSYMAQQYGAATNICMTHNYITNLEKVIAKSRGLIIPYTCQEIGDVPLSAIEALAVGRPVITTQDFTLPRDCSANPSVVKIAPDSNILAKTLKELSEKTKYLEQQCLELANCYNQKDFCQEYQSLYQNMIDNGR